MVGGVQQAVAVWAVLTVPFVLVGAYLWSRGALGARFVVAYWVPAVVLTATGAFPPALAARHRVRRTVTIHA